MKKRRELDVAYRSTAIYKALKRKTDEKQMTQYLSAIEKSCDAAVVVAMHIIRTFPTFTLHNETHFTNVLEIMAKLIGSHQLERLTIEELSMLLLCACCHDLGMSVSPEEKKKLTATEPLDQSWETYFVKHPNEKKRYREVRGKRQKEDFLLAQLPKLVRTSHHERIQSAIKYIPWDDILLQPPLIEMTPLNRSDLCVVCKSHGQPLEKADSELQSHTKERLDLHMCAVLLRLGDILDFDASRAPKTLYNFLELSNPSSKEEEISKTEWDKHLTNGKFVITDSNNKSGAYAIPYIAECNDPDVYDGICRYMNWVDVELECANQKRSLFDAHLGEITFPYRVDRIINLISDGLEQEKLKQLSAKFANWLIRLPIHWGPLDNSDEMQNANTCEALISLKTSGYHTRFEKQCNIALQQLLNNVTEKGLPSKSLSAETTVCTSMLLYLVQQEKNNKIIGDSLKFDKLAEILWEARNDQFGWGVYVSKTDDEDCICANTYWALRALNHYDIGKTSTFRKYVTQIYQKSKDGLWGFVYEDEPRIVTTAMYLGLYYELDSSFRRALDKHYHRKKAINYIIQSFADDEIQIEVETLHGIEKAGNNSVKKAPWNHILVGYVLDVVSNAYDHGDIGKEELQKIRLHLRKVLKKNVCEDYEIAYYIPENIIKDRNRIYTYPTMYMLYGISKISKKELIQQ